MSKLLIQTQVHENYGTGEKPYWKAKGGNDYVVKNFNGGEDASTQAIMSLRAQIENDSAYFQEYIIGWKLVGDDYLTQFEKDQLEFDGYISYPVQELVWN